MRLLALLPVDVADGLRKEQLKKSGLGKVVMFLYKLPDESLENRRAAKVLRARTLLGSLSQGGLSRAQSRAWPLSVRSKSWL